MNSRRQFITLAGLLLLILFVFAGVENYELDRIRAEIQENVAAADASVDGLNQVRIADARFKNQVQEWKNILLRGEEPADFRRYRDAFEEEADAVREALARLGERAGATPGIEEGHIAGLLEEHAAVRERYRAAMAAGGVERVGDARAVDTAVRGVDRDFTEALRELAGNLELAADAASRKVTADALARIEEQKDSTHVAVGLASAVIVGLVIVFLAFRSPS